MSIVQRYPHPFLVFGVTFLVSSICTASLFFLARRRAALLPVVRSRDVHSTPKPRVGGVAMWLSVGISFAWLLSGSSQENVLNFNRPTFLHIDISLWGILLGMLVILVMGLIDDLRGISWKGQLLGQLLASLFLVAGGIVVPFLRLPFNHQLILGGVSFQVGTMQSVSLASAVFTVVWVMVMINVMNFFDGLDGLAGSVALLASLCLFLVSVKVGFIATATLSLIVAGATAGFLPWNWYPSRIFMGTVGSQLLGFLLAVIAVISGGKVATAILVLGIPVLDALIVIVRRILAGQSPFKADQRHLHHRLLSLGLPVPVVVLGISGVSAVFGLLALAASESNTKGLLTLLLIGAMGVVIAITYALEQRSRNKVD